MTPQELRNSIIKKALEGKLVDNIQDNSELAEVLKKARLKNKSQPITDNEIEIEHPDNWIDFRIAEIFDIRNGFTPLRTNDDFWKDGTVNWFTVDDIHNQGRYITDTKVKINSCACTNDRIAPSNSLFICCTASVGEYALSKIPMTSNQQFNALTVKKEFDPFIDMEFFLAIAPFFKDRLLRIAGKTTFPFISVKKLGNLVFSVPCVEEQKCIVAKIKELTPLVDRYEKAWNKLKVFNERFPIDMELSIIKYALQGKLADQIIDEGTGEQLFNEINLVKKDLITKKLIKKDKPLDPISDDDLPFEIPSSWRWVYLGEIFLHNTGKAQNSSGSTNGVIRKFITTSNLYWNRFDFSKVKEMPFTEAELERCTVKKGDLLVCEGGDYGRSAIWTYDEEMCIQNHVHRLRPYYGLDIKFYYYMMFYYKNAGLLRGRGVAIQGLSNEAIHKVICPLPPLEEQKRIVTKLEELLPLCRKLIK